MARRAPAVLQRLAWRGEPAQAPLPLQDAKKNLLKVNGGAWLGTTAMHLYFAHDGVERKEVAYSAAALAAVLGTLCLWRGFKKDDEEDEGEKKKAA